MPENYCRACGKGKGHNFDHCTNHSALRGLIKVQDEQIGNKLALEKRINDLEQRARELKSDWILHRRLIAALLSLFELLQLQNAN